MYYFPKDKEVESNSLETCRKIVRDSENWWEHQLQSNHYSRCWRTIPSLPNDVTIQMWFNPVLDMNTRRRISIVSCIMVYFCMYESKMYLRLQGCPFTGWLPCWKRSTFCESKRSVSWLDNRVLSCSLVLEDSQHSLYSQSYIILNIFLYRSHIGRNDSEIVWSTFTKYQLVFLRRNESSR